MVDAAVGSGLDAAAHVVLRCALRTADAIQTRAPLRLATRRCKLDLAEMEALSASVEHAAWIPLLWRALEQQPYARPCATERQVLLARATQDVDDRHAADVFALTTRALSRMVRLALLQVLPDGVRKGGKQDGAGRKSHKQHASTIRSSL